MQEHQKNSAVRYPELVLVGLVAGIYFFAMSYLIPFSEGRDVGTYFLYWQGMFETAPPYPLLMLFRTPVTPVFFGVAYQLAGQTGAQLALAGGYVLTMVIVYRTLRTYARWVACLGVVMVFANIQLFEVFNSVASEAPQTILIVLWAGLVFAAMKQASPKLGIALGLATFLLVICRPANQLLLPACFLPLLGGFVWNNRTATTRTRLVCALVAFSVAAGLTAGYMTYNWARYGQFCIARLGGASVPFYRMFLQERLIRPENGPRSAELADLARRKVLPHPTFQAYGIDERTFFEFSTSRMFDALFRASAEERGWDNDFDLFRDAAWECMDADPKEFWLSYADGVYGMFSIRDKPMFRLSDSRERRKAFRSERERRYAMYAEQGIRVPSEGDLLVATGWWLSVLPPEEANRPQSTRWFAPKGWEHARRELPSEIMESFRAWSLKISPSWLQLSIGLVGTMLAFSVGRGDPRLLLASASCLLVLLATWFGVLLRYYRFPFDPIFTMFFCYGLFALAQSAAEIRVRYFGLCSAQNSSRPLSHI